MPIQEHRFTRLSPLLLALVTTLIAVITFGLRDRRNIGSFNVFVRENRDTVALAIQIVSSILGVCQVYAITASLTFAARLKVQKDSVQLETIKAWTAFLSRQPRTWLRCDWLLGLCLFLIVTQIPAALWAGALTPIFVEYTVREGTIQVPTYPLSSANLWQGAFNKTLNGTFTTHTTCTKNRYIDAEFNAVVVGNNGPRGFVSSCPSLDHLSTLINSAGTASTASLQEQRIHARIDNSGWLVIGRSYGVGSSPGLVDIPTLSSLVVPVKGFSYQEYGYDTHVSCSFNESANYFLLDQGSFEVGDSDVSIFQANGTLPNSRRGSVESYAVAGVGSSWGNYFAWSTAVDDEQHMLAVAGTGWYTYLDKLQCSATFTPRLFSVYVNTTSTTITVSPSTDNSSAVNIEPTGTFTTSIFDNVEALSRFAGQTTISSLGDPIIFNSVMVKFQYPDRNASFVYPQALADSVTAIIDDLLIAYAQAQTVLFRNATTTPITARFDAIRIGSDKYIFSVLASTVLILLIVVTGMTWTRFYRDLDRFDFTDVSSMVIAASAGGRPIADAVYARHAGDGTLWEGDPSDRKAGGVVVKLRLRRDGKDLVRLEEVGGDESSESEQSLTYTADGDRGKRFGTGKVTGARLRNCP